MPPSEKPPERPVAAGRDGPLIALEGVGKSYNGGTEALRDFSLRVDGGEFVALVGPSGCGKSTALRLAAGLERPTAGRVGRAASLAGGGAIGCVFQDPTLMPWSRVEDNVRLPLRLRGEPRRDAQAAVREALHRVGLDGFARAYPGQLSGGMKMRVAVARATASAPRLLMLDEPFAALDEITRSRLNHDLLDLWRTQRWGCLFVTHSVYEAVFLASRVVVMSARPGRVLAEAPSPLPRPRTEATRRDPAYAAACGEVSDALARALGEPACPVTPAHNRENR